MALQLPEGKRLAISLSPDFDAHSVWMGTFRTSSQTALSRGEFGAEVGGPRLLDTFDRYGITTTWCIPTHTMQTFPDAVASVVDRGHEIAAHGVYHEYVPKLELDEERRLMELQLKLHEELIGLRPRGYRSPALDVTDNTLAVLHEFGLEWDSSLMGRDFEPYHPRMVTVIDREAGNQFGEPSPLLEFPVSWGLDDFPELEMINGNATQQANAVVLQRWKDAFDFAYERCPGGMMTWTLHPQTIGRSHNLLMLEQFIEYVQSHDGVWFPTISEAADAWVDPVS
ncbi:peptidoglycan/xylan/chitin deacetylase (PgdA/CDA1 family) [Leucobacter exalbidus]|uniref:Peptidoglycan/xylan/chitin deacetylase (PgdA/CDA1 family) n=1 Tax=Leucobacter exalbidus TaxID=662960 RepID=A0A940T3Z2_9MICO|nr:polysaccharide deacetylase [Leucobacter exalbidus]MBP1326687.1 peptidoglycan/xylan/chitin deacetylase (PgdA/CDA1 family) [Leucobacter exalbidus]